MKIFQTLKSLSLNQNQKKKLIGIFDYLFIYVPFMGLPMFIWSSVVLIKLLDKNVVGLHKLFYFIGLVPGILLIGVPTFIISTKIGKPFNRFLSYLFNYDESIVNHEKNTIHYEYNDNNQLVRLIEFDSYGSLKEKTKITYNSNYKPVEEINFDSKNSIIWRIVYKYEPNGNLIEEIKFDSQGKKSTVKTRNQDGGFLKKLFGNYGIIEETHYDVEDRITKIIDYESGDSGLRVISSESEYKYNQEGKEIENTFTDFKEKNYKTISNYDSEGKLIEEVDYDSDEKISWTEKSYDSRGYHIKTKLYYKDVGVIYVKKYNYYDDGKLYEESEYDSDSYDSLKEYWKIEYDSMGNIIKEELYDSEHKLKYKESNEYNSNGLIIKKTMNDLDKPPPQIQMDIHR